MDYSRDACCSAFFQPTYVRKARSGAAADTCMWFSLQVLCLFQGLVADLYIGVTVSVIFSLLSISEAYDTKVCAQHYLNEQRRIIM